MKKTKTILLAAALCVGVAVQAQPTVKLLYEGKSLPTEQGWSEWKLDSSVNPVAAKVTLEAAGGALKLTSVNAPDQYSQLGWYQLNPGLDLDKGYTIELKAKLKVAQKGSFNIQGYDNSGKGFRVTIADAFLTNRSDPLKATDSIASGLTADDEFHVYRLAAKPSGSVDVYRDGAKIGEFALSTFAFDNIVENGGFEDEEFPDFLSNGILQRVTDTGKVYAGTYALEANSNDKVTDYASGNMEAFRTRPFAVKPGTDYAISITRRRTSPEPYAWRDLGVFYDDQEGTFGGSDKRTPNLTWGSVNDPHWLVHSHNFTTPEEGKKSVRFEFPSWTRENTKKTQIASFDNIIFRERIGFSFNSSIPSGISGPVFPEGYVNLIANGGFEDHTINNDGAPFEWALSNEDTQNLPTSQNDVWGGEVRIQRNDKTDDFDGVPDQWAHSGTSSLRFSTLNAGKKFDFAKELEPGKTYRFNFWHRSPKWADAGVIKVKLGNNDIWGHELIAKNNVWANADLVFTTTDENKTLHLYTDKESGWFNVYFDDLVLYEVTGAADPQIAGKTNLIANGDFEDATIDNNGNSYTWALASGSSKPGDDNYPVAWSDQWGSYVRLQDVQKSWDTGLEWAHSGSKALRFSFLDNIGAARTFEGIASDEPQTTLPKAYRINLNFEKALEAHKTYTFVFWVKAANYPDKGALNVANGDVALWKEELSTKYVNWTRHSITFSTTEANRTLRIFTEFGSWFNFYLDDLFLYEEDTYVPYQNDNSYIFFGKSQTTASADVEVEYVKLFTGGAHAPGEEAVVSATLHYALSEGVDTTVYAEYDVTDAAFPLPIPEREYHSFVGWYENADFTGGAVDTIPQGATGAKEYWGKWQLSSAEFTITYHVNGGSEIPDSVYTITSDAIALPAATGKNGYAFAGWYGSAELTGDAATEVPTGSIGNKEFWAKWSAISYTIYCYANGATGIADTTTIAYTIEESVALPTLAGYDVRWYGDAEGDGLPSTEIVAGSYGDIHLWAKSEAIRYTITYHANGGERVSDSAFTIESEAVTLTATTKEGYVFAGWYDNAELAGDAVAEVPAGSIGNKDFWAKWTAEEPTAVSSVAASALRIYPNPVVNGLLTIDNPSGSKKVEIYTVSGTLAGVYSVSAAGGQAVVDISALPSGTYIVKAGGKTAKIVNLRNAEL
jgi:uncharacterized repeat protein (TIGR02543 family)